jgi:Uma2 family endonuclease
LISRIGKNRPHVNAAMALMLRLMDACGRDRVDQEAPIDVAPGDNQINEPTPDLIVLRKPGSLIRSGNPQPEDLAMVVEIADSSLAFDLGLKARLYARAGIAEYWVADLNGRHLVVHRKPGAEGYGDVAAYGETEAVRPLAAPEHEFLLNAIL